MGSQSDATPLTAPSILAYAAAGVPIPIQKQSGQVFLPLQPDVRHYTAQLQIPVRGTLVLGVTSPRPLRLVIGPQRVLDEHLSWRSFQRKLTLAVVYPVAAGQIAVAIDVGLRPRHPAAVDASCPSRDRAQLLERLAREMPDALCVSMQLREPSSEGDVAAAIRFEPSQLHCEGVVWQRIYVRPLVTEDSPPSCTAYCYDEMPVPTVKLASVVGPRQAIDRTTDAERQAGVRRLYVPVATHAEPFAPLRSTGPEHRAEPVVETAGQTQLTVETRSGSTVIDMPVFESLGRHAPRREFAKIQWPTLEQVLAAAPELILPPQWEHLESLYREAWAMLLRLARVGSPEEGLPCGFISTGTNFPSKLFLWDTAFTAMAAAYAWRVLDATASLDVQYSRQFDGGYIHREHDTRDGLPIMCEPGFSPNPPLLTIAEWKIASLSGDLHRLRRVWPVLIGYHEWLRHNRRLPDGTYWTTGLANGLDNSPSLGEGYPDLTAQMAHDAQTLARIAKLLGYTSEAAELRCEYAQTVAAMERHLWSDDLQCYSTSLADGSHNPNKVVTGFWPLWTGGVAEQRVEHLCRHALDPASFYRHHPLPSLAADSPHYKPEGDYWLGSTWAPTNYAAIKGFARVGRMDVARQLTLRHLQVMHEVFLVTGNLWENYAADTVAPGSRAAPDYCWTALGPIALLLETLVGLEPDALNMTLRWHPPQASCGVRRYPLGPATIDLWYDAVRKRIKLHTNRAFRLCLSVSTSEIVHIIGPGEQVIDVGNRSTGGLCCHPLGGRKALKSARSMKGF